MIGGEHRKRIGLPHPERTPKTSNHSIMAQIKKGVLGGFTGSIGNIVGFHRQGNDYIRTKPAQVRNPNTEAQQQQRLRFTLMIALLKSIKPFIKAGFKLVTGKRTAFSAAMSVNVKKAITGVFPDYIIDPQELVVAQGSLFGSDVHSLDLSVAGTATVTWQSDTSTSQAAEDDIAMILLYNTVNGEVAYRLNAGARSTESASLPIPAGWSGSDIAAFLAFRSADESAVSNSIYVGTEIAA